MFTPRFQLFYLLGTFAAFCITAWATRARARTIAGAVVGVAVFTILSAPIDTLAARLGLWWYPSGTPSIVVYVGQSLSFVGCVSLIAARVRRVGIVVALVCVCGLIRDFSAAALKPSLIAFGPPPAAQLGDLAAWLVVCACAIAIPRALKLRAAPADRLQT
jgi:hypothetical protein